MPQVTYPQVNGIITRSGELFIPDLIEDGIITSIINPLDAIRNKGADLKRIYSALDHAVTVDYSDPLVVDAYSLYYTRRNTLIPRVALRDMVMNSKLQMFPTDIKVLDVGTGTGAVVIGLLEMFLHPPLNKIKIHVDAIDASPSCLDRLRYHLKATSLSKFEVNTSVQDICDIQTLDSFLAKSGPYNLLFIANVFNEIEHNQSCEVMRCLSMHLTNTAVIVVASAQRNFIKELQPQLVEEATSDGLFVYYPCPQHDISNHDCFFWREHDYRCKQLRRKGSQFIASPGFREQLVATWLILCNKRLSIFDDFRTKNPELDWGVFRIWGKDSLLYDCEICTNGGRKKLPPQKYSIQRGAIVGCTGDPPKIQQFFNL